MSRLEDIAYMQTFERQFLENGLCPFLGLIETTVGLQLEDHSPLLSQAIQHHAYPDRFCSHA